MRQSPRDTSADSVTPPGRTMPARPGTRQRILDASRILFNQNGMQATAVYKIAESLSISPGNLTYHFKSKSDIIAALAAELENGVDHASRSFDQPANAANFISLMERFLTVLWNYRFLFNSSHYLGGIDADLAAGHYSLRDTLRALTGRSMAQLTEQGSLRAPRRPNNGGIVADNIVAIWIGWLQDHALDPPTPDDAPTKVALRQCIERHFSVIEPYLSEHFVANFLVNWDRSPANTD